MPALGNMPSVDTFACVYIHVIVKGRALVVDGHGRVKPGCRLELGLLTLADGDLLPVTIGHALPLPVAFSSAQRA
jgi:hypothetical protein